MCSSPLLRSAYSYIFSLLQVRNETKQQLEILSVANHQARPAGVVASHSDLHVPLALSTGSELRIRQNFGGEHVPGSSVLVNKGSRWEQTSYYTLPDGERMFLHSQISALYGDRRLLTVRPGFVVRNLLPESVRIGVKTAGRANMEFSEGYVECGDIHECYRLFVGLQTEIELHLQLLGPDGAADWQPSQTRVSFSEEPIRVPIRHKKKPVVLTVIIRFVSRFEVELFSQHWLCNKSGFQVSLNCPGKWNSWPSVESLGIGDVAGVCSMDLVGAKTLQIRVGASMAKEITNVQKLRQGELVLPSKQERMLYGLNFIIDTSPGPFRLSRSITLRPLHGIVNELSYPIWVRGGDDRLSYSEPQMIHPGATITAFHMRKPPDMKTSLGKLMVVQIGVTMENDPTLIRWAPFFPERGSVSDQEMRTNPINLGENRTIDKLVTCDILKSSPEVANLITVSSLFDAADCEDHNADGHGHLGVTLSDVANEFGKKASNSKAPFILFMQFSRILISMKHMDMLRHRDKVDPVSQRECLHGPVLTLKINGVGAKLHSAGEHFDVGISIATAEIVNLKGNQGRGQRFLLANQRTELKIESERRPELWYISLLSLQIGAISVSTTDEFILAWLELQNNLFEYVSGEFVMPTPQAIMRSFCRERKGRTKNPDATMFIKSMLVTKFNVDLQFLRKTNKAMDLFPIPKGTVRSRTG